ncbi:MULTISPECIES: hypothetical protein [unclassified Methylophaga]|mgnify:CR=1|jgi:hypothetical protein|uniref:hypothetical protein n=1 Tax=unclassified Methylophaga TaxID=2629249 RepID=UPI000C958422|nr:MULTISPECIES: hypothetical protein [unclassified Methylophaga]MAP27753.1 hypothetical protein [Methylophaga sp.]|tara:strand:- start:1887 stop:2189 length:303 start_codon:yes stop_codon:yes gene_type:complete
MGNYPEGIRQFDSHPLSPFAETGLSHDMDLTIGDTSYEAIITYDMNGDRPSVTKARINIDGVWAAIESDHFDFIEDQMIAEREESELSQKLAVMESDYDY